jgi:hypothetical protein
MLHPRTLSAFALVFASLVAPAATQADLIVSNLSADIDGFDSINEDFFFAQQFTTGSTSFTLQSIQAYLNASPGNSSSAIAELALDNSGVPGTVVAAFATGSSLPDGDNTVTFLPTAPTVLAANTTYYFILGASTGSDPYSWYSTTSGVSTGTGTLGESAMSADSGASFTSQGSGVQYLIQINSVPEPASLVLFGGGLALAALVHRRRRRR